MLLNEPSFILWRPLRDASTLPGNFILSHPYAMLFLMKASLLASALSFGGIAFASLHVRLGLGAFFRPTLGLGALFGTPEVEAGGGMVAELSQVAFLTRIGLPFA